MTLDDVVTALRDGPAAMPDPGYVERILLTLLADVIGADDIEALDATVPLVALGLDSLNALHLRRRVKAEFSCEVVVSELLNGVTLNDVVRMVKTGSKGQSNSNERPDKAPAPSGRLRHESDYLGAQRSGPVRIGCHLAGAGARTG